jgi:hypothetical protein
MTNYYEVPEMQAAPEPEIAYELNAIPTDQQQQDLATQLRMLQDIKTVKADPEPSRYQQIFEMPTPQPKQQEQLY